MVPKVKSDFRTKEAGFDEPENRGTGIATQVFNVDEFRKTHPDIFLLLDTVKDIAIERRKHGVQQYSDPLSFFDLGGFRSYFDHNRNNFGIDINLYHGPNGLSGADNYRPNFFLRISGDDFYFSFKRRYFESSSPLLKTGDENHALEMLAGWAQSYAPEFSEVYEARGGRKDIDYEEYMSQAIQFAMQQRRLDREQNNEAVEPVEYDGDENYQTISLEPYPLTPKEIEENAAKANFAHSADLIRWGRKIGHMISQAATRIKSSIITKDVQAGTELQNAIDETRTKMASFGVKLDKAKRRGLWGAFRKKAPPVVELNANEFLIETLDQFYSLSDAVFQDQDRCLRMIGNVEAFIKPFEEYGDILGYYRGLLFDAYKKRAAEKTSLDGVADEQSNQVLSGMKERLGKLKLDIETHQGVALGIQNFMVCKQSQYDGYELFIDKIKNDVELLIQSAMIKAETLSKADQVEIVLDTVSEASKVLDELQVVVDAGAEYDQALVLDKTRTIRPLGIQQQGETKLLMSPDAISENDVPSL